MPSPRASSHFLVHLFLPTEPQGVICFSLGLLFCYPSLYHIVPFNVAWSFFGQMVDNEGLFLSQGVGTGMGGEEETLYPFLELRIPESPALGLRGTVLPGCPGPEEQEPFVSLFESYFP